MNSEEEGGYAIGNDDMAVSFSDEENIAIASIDLNSIKPFLPTEQFAALSKLVGCVASCVYLSQGGQKQ